MMSESQAPQQPPQATQTTVVTVESKPASSGQGEIGLGIRFNPYYFKTVPGILKIVQLVLGIVCMALASPAHVSATSWFLFVVTTSFIITLIWFFIYLLSLREALPQLHINWILTELVYTGIAFILYVIAFITQLATWAGYERNIFGFYYWSTTWDCNIAAGVFGIFNSAVYGFGAFLLYRDWKGTRVAQ